MGMHESDEDGLSRKFKAGMVKAIEKAIQTFIDDIEEYDAFSECVDEVAVSVLKQPEFKALVRDKILSKLSVDKISEAVATRVVQKLTC